MRARKVAILLAVAALSALTLFFVLLADSEAMGAELGGQDGPAMETRQGPDSEDHVEVLVEMGQAGCGDLRLCPGTRATGNFTDLSGPLSSPWCGLATTFKKGR